MNTNLRRFSLLFMAIWLGVAVVGRADLIHRYSFAADANDSVGTAHGVLKGNGAYFDGAGQLVLPGGTTSNVGESVSGYVDLPNHIINVLTNITVEAWVTWNGSAVWERVFDFGISSTGEDVSSGEGGYLFLCTSPLRFAVQDPATQNEPVILNAPGILMDPNACLTVTYDYTANVSRLYSNGVLMATGPASVDLKTINDVNNWLGRSQWDDSMFTGSYDEFRIYDTALTALEVNASYLSGTENPSTDVAALGALQAVHLTIAKTTLVQGDKLETTVTADFAKISGLPLAGIAGVVYSSDDATVATVSTAGLVEAVGVGTASISVAYGGKTDSFSLVVNPRQTGLANAGTLWVDLRAADLGTSTANWPNKTGKGDFGAAGTPVYEANVAGTGVAGVTFNGTTDAYLGPVTDPDLDGSSDRSIEIWVFNPSVAAEETLVAWSHRGGPDGSNLSFNFGGNTTYGAVGHWGGYDVGWSGTPTAGEWHYLAYTYDGLNTARVYADGLLKTKATLPGPLDTYVAFPIRIGAQCNTTADDFDFGQALSGSLALVRIHGGQLSDNDVRNNFFYGVELTPSGELQGITMKVDAPELLGVGAGGQASVTAHYAARNYLKVDGYCTFESADPSILSIDAAGKYKAAKVGTTTIKAIYLGKEAVQTIKVITPAPVLMHRYSFSEAVGATTVKDSAGTANGVLKGEGAAFDGNGQLSLPGGTSSAADPVAGYVDLPNGIISVRTNLTIESWVTLTYEGASAWQRIFDFGTSAGGEDISDGNGNYIFLSPESSANLRFAVRDPATATEPVQATSGASLPKNTEVCVTVTYNYSANSTVLYSNAVQVAISTASVKLSTINDVNNWLGRSQWGDPMFQGKYNEFRIWEGAMSADEVAASVAAGPDKLPSPEKPTSVGINASGGNVVISWPADATGYFLESTKVLGPNASWDLVLETPVEDGGMKKVTLPIQGTAQFFRLSK